MQKGLVILLHPTNERRVAYFPEGMEGFVAPGLRPGFPIPLEGHIEKINMDQTHFIERCAHSNLPPDLLMSAPTDIDVIY